MREVLRAAAVPVLLVVLSGCTAGPVLTPNGSPPPAAAPATGSATPGSATPTSARPPAGGGGDLAGGPLQHSVKGDGLTVSLEYAPESSVERWTPDGAKPVQVSVTVTNNRQPREKVFLTRATMRFTVSDGNEEVLGPDPLVDTANLSPGYLVTFPYSYNQSFAIPPLDAGARLLVVDLKVELVSLVDPKAKDYTKQTITDSVSVDITS